MSKRWVSGVTLERHFGFTAHKMRHMRALYGRLKKNNMWLYDFDLIMKNYSPIKAIPKHLIMTEDDGIEWAVP